MDRRKAQRFLIAAVLMLSVAVNFNGVAANPIHAPLEKDITAEGEAAIGVSGKTAESIPFLVEICGSGLVLNLYVARKPQFLLQGLSQCR